ncbi:MAG: hypothetical protein LEGION0403_FIIPPAGN_02761 [Legionella sp.]|uniref:hypothetical protein n=1 Tax=Legionella sp. TaxID=459 RepID=UPI003D0FB7CD
MGAGQESNAVFSVEQANDLLTQMQAPIRYDLKKPTVSVPLLNRILFVSQFVKNASELGDKAIHVGSSFTEIPGMKTPAHLNHGFHWGRAALTALLERSREAVIASLSYEQTMTVTDDLPDAVEENRLASF